MKKFLWLMGLTTFWQGGSFWFLPMPWSYLSAALVPFCCGGCIRCWKQVKTYEERIYFFSWMLFPFLGPLATFGGFLAISLLLFTPKNALEKYRKNLVQEFEFTPLDRVRFYLSANLWDDDSDYSMEPFVDIMKGKDTFLKQSVVDKMIQHPGALSVVVLKEGLKDENSDIRYYAASGLIQLNDLFQTKMGSLQKQMEEDPQNPMLSYSLGETCDLYCHWDLPSSDIKHKYLKQAEEYFLSCLDLQPDHEEACGALGRLLVQQKRIDEAFQVLEKGLKHHPESVNIISWLAEALFCRGDLERLVQLARQCSINLDLPDTLSDSMNYWAFYSAIPAQVHQALLEERKA